MELFTRHRSITRGDSILFRIDLSHPCTVKEFIQYVIDTYPKESGRISIAPTDINIQYFCSEIAVQDSTVSLADYLDRSVSSVDGYQGFTSCMDYMLHVDE